MLKGIKILRKKETEEFKGNYKQLIARRADLLTRGVGDLIACSNS